MQRMQHTRVPVLLLSGVMVGLSAVVAYAVWEGATPKPAPPPVYADVGEPQTAFTAEEEAYAAALWPIHRGVGETAAVNLTFAGMAYATEGHDAGKLKARVEPLVRTFRAARMNTEKLTPPRSLQAVHARYLEALSLYQQAATEMLQVTDDGDDRHLVSAQALSQRAAEEVVKAGDILWPGEHKPN
jgi:hypothetical protein